MFPSTVSVALMAVLLVALPSMDAYPLKGRRPSISLTARTTTKSLKNLVAADKSRVNKMKHTKTAGKRSALDVAGENDYFFFTTDVGIGTPATQYTLIVDTGSANTWVGALQSYTITSSSVDMHETVGLDYGSGSFSGEEYSDTMTFESGLVIKDQGIGAAATSTGFSDADGILGLGPVDLTTDSTANGEAILTVTDTMYLQGLIDTETLGIFLTPSSLSSDTAGEISFGSVDTSKTTSTVTYTPITSTSPASYYWGIDLSINYGTTTILSTTAGIVDVGTLLTYIATDAFSQYLTATGAVADDNTGLYIITNDQYSKLSNLSFIINGQSFDLTPNGQIWPRSLNTYMGGDSNSIYIIIADIGAQSGSGFDFMLGMTLLQRFYSVYDSTNQQVGMATTSYTTAITN